MPFERLEAQCRAKQCGQIWYVIAGLLSLRLRPTTWIAIITLHTTPSTSADGLDKAHIESVVGASIKREPDETLAFPGRSIPQMGWIKLRAGLRTKTGYLFELECLRGLAIALAFLFHAFGISQLNGKVEAGFFNSFIIAGNTGVTLFFVLSGFLLSLPWWRHQLDSAISLPNVSSFYLARAWRILPLYLFAVLFSVVATGN